MALLPRQTSPLFPLGRVLSPLALAQAISPFHLLFFAEKKMFLDEASASGLSILLSGILYRMILKIECRMAFYLRLLQYFDLYRHASIQGNNAISKQGCPS